MLTQKLFIIIYITCALAGYAQAPSAQHSDSLATTTDSIATTSQRSRNLIGKIVGYFEQANKPKPEKRLDFSFIGGPAYTNDTKLSIGLLGSALYKSVPFDSLTPQSNASLYSQFSITGFWLVGIKGNHIGPRDSYRVDYKVNFQSFPNHFWGIGYDTECNDDNETKYLQLSSLLEASIVWKLGTHLFLGPAVRFNYTKAKNIAGDNIALWDNEALRTTNYAMGFNFYYDTRDFIPNPYKGLYLAYEQRFYPRFMKNSYCFSSSELTFNYYHRLWRSAIFAGQVHALFTYGNTPWSMLATLGGSHSMRGYYEGRYRDKCAADMTLELRQHVWRRSSAVAWIGAGSIAPKISEFRHAKVLPNFGIGYRWEFKNRVNVRLDFGFGKGEKGAVFSINEAF